MYLRNCEVIIGSTQWHHKSLEETLKLGGFPWLHYPKKHHVDQCCSPRLMLLILAVPSTN